MGVALPHSHPPREGCKEEVLAGVGGATLPGAGVGWQQSRMQDTHSWMLCCRGRGLSPLAH